MIQITSVCVYCGSGSGRNPAHAAAAEALGRTFAREGVRLVYGGGSIGLMGTIARACLDAGGEVTGIIPRFLVRRERMLEGVTDLVVTEDMHARKRLMFERSDAFVALPGGIGTLEETVEMLTWLQLRQHEKPVVLANIEGFWNPLCKLLEHMREEAFIRAGYEVPLIVVERPEHVLPALRKAAAGMATAEAQPGRDAPPLERL